MSISAEFHHSDKIGSDIRTFWFKPYTPVDYVAGQFTEIYLPHSADDRGERRWFTLSSSPTEELLSVTTRILGEHGSSFKHELAGLKPGAKLNLAEPMGDFVLPKGKETPLMFIGAGIGVTPFRSMVKWLHDSNEQRDIRLVHSVKRTEDAVFADLFRDCGVNCKIILGEITSDKIIGLSPASDALIYLAGPEYLVERLDKELKQKGIDGRQIVADFFHGYGTI